jgi:predicted TIM-barrel fold metal-dependent hydrolase
MAAEDGIVGVQLPAAGLVPPAGHRSYDPVYEAAADHDLPILMHTHDLQGPVTFPVQRRWAETFTESHAFVFPAEAMWHLVSLVCNGVPERFPDLEWVLQEPGFEWVPWMMWRLDDHYLQNIRDLPMLTKRPSEYIREQFHFTTQPLGHTENNRYLGRTMEMAGASETVLFSTDHPHPDFDPPKEVLVPARTHLEEAEVRGLMGESAIELFGIR